MTNERRESRDRASRRKRHVVVEVVVRASPGVIVRRDSAVIEFRGERRGGAVVPAHPKG